MFSCSDDDSDSQPLPEMDAGTAVPDGGSSEPFGDIPETYATNFQSVDPLPQVDGFVTDIDTAYDFQRLFVAALVADGFTRNGYKVGFSRPDPLPFGAPGPVYGRMFEELERESGAAIDVSDSFVMGTVGLELILVMNANVETLPAGNVTLSDVQDVVSQVIPVFEMPDLGYEPALDPMNADDYLNLIAGNAGSRLYVRGPAVDFEDIPDIDAVTVSATVDGSSQLTDAMGNPTTISTTTRDAVRFSEGLLGSIVFLVNELRAQNDPPLAEGDLVFSAALGGDAPAGANLGQWVGTFAFGGTAGTQTVTATLTE